MASRIPDDLVGATGNEIRRAGRDSKDIYEGAIKPWVLSHATVSVVVLTVATLGAIALLGAASASPVGLAVGIALAVTALVVGTVAFSNFQKLNYMLNLEWTKAEDTNPQIFNRFGDVIDQEIPEEAKTAAKTALGKFRVIFVTSSEERLQLARPEFAKIEGADADQQAAAHVDETEDASSLQSGAQALGREIKAFGRKAVKGVKTLYAQGEAAVTNINETPTGQDMRAFLLESLKKEEEEARTGDVDLEEEGRAQQADRKNKRSTDRTALTQAILRLPRDQQAAALSALGDHR